MNINKKDIQDYIINNFDIYKDQVYHYTNLYEIYQINNDDINSKYLIKKLRLILFLMNVKLMIKNIIVEKVILTELKKLKLPDQRTPEWYALRKKY